MADSSVLILGVAWRRRWRETVVDGRDGSVVVVFAPVLILRTGGISGGWWSRLTRPGICSMRSVPIGLSPWLYYRVPDVVGRELLAIHASGAFRARSRPNLRILGGPERGLAASGGSIVMIPLAVVGLWLGGERGSRFRRGMTGLALGLVLAPTPALRADSGSKSASPKPPRTTAALASGSRRSRCLAGRGDPPPVGVEAAILARTRALVVGAVGLQLVRARLGLGWYMISVRHNGKERPTSGPARSYQMLARGGPTRPGDRLESAGDHRLVRWSPVDVPSRLIPTSSTRLNERFADQGGLPVHRHGTSIRSTSTRAGLALASAPTRWGCSNLGISEVVAGLPLRFAA